jgi:pilus assembly protein CpaF
MNSLDRIFPFLNPIAHLLQDRDVTEIMINAGGRQIFVETSGEMRQVFDIRLTDYQVSMAAKNIARSFDEDISNASPILDARLEDGSRVAVMFPPCSVDGITMTIRRFGRRYSLEDLVECGGISSDQAGQLVGAIQARQNILISGGTNTGKTTLLNGLAAHIPDAQRLALLEDTPEISIHNSNLIRFTTRREQKDVPAVPMAALLKAALRHRPDRIILGEVRGAEAFDLLQALNTGHQGSMTTIHANSAPDALHRLADCVAMSGFDLPDRVVRGSIARAVHVVVHLGRIGPRRTVTDIIAVHDHNPQTGAWIYESILPTSTEVFA